MTTPKRPTPDTPMLNLGDIVRKKVRSDEAGMIIGITYRLGGTVEYHISWAENTAEQIHYEQELTLDSEFVERAN